jgi:hypothetical protein
MRDAWNEWFQSPDPNFTKHVNRQRPSYEKDLEMVSQKCKKIALDRELIKKV